MNKKLAMAINVRAIPGKIYLAGVKCLFIFIFSGWMTELFWVVIAFLFCYYWGGSQETSGTPPPTSEASQSTELFWVVIAFLFCYYWRGGGISRNKWHSTPYQWSLINLNALVPTNATLLHEIVIQFFFS